MGLSSDLFLLRLDPFCICSNRQIISQAEQDAGSEMPIAPTVHGHKEKIFKYLNLEVQSRNE